MVHLSHAVTDVGGVEVSANFYDLDREPPPQDVPPLPLQDLSPNDLMRQGFNRLPGAIAGGVRDALSRRGPAVGSVIRDPVSSVGSAVRLRHVECPRDGCSRRTVAGAATPELVVRGDAIDIEFGDLHRAAKAAGGSSNKRCLCGALRLYHGGHGRADRHVADGLRSTCDPTTTRPGGNRFAGVNLAARSASSTRRSGSRAFGPR